MSALRRAGVWLGLVEDEDDLYEDESGLIDLDRDTGSNHRHGRERGRDRGRSRDRRTHHRDDEEFLDEDEAPPSGSHPHGRTHGPRGQLSHGQGDGEEPPPVPRERATDRIPRRRGEGEASVRSIARDPNVSYITRDNLALAPQVEQSPVPVERERYQITTLHPTTYREARTIGEHFRNGTPVIMNLTEMDEADARRLVDFGAGLAFGLHGTMERVTNRVFLLSPANIQVTPEDKARIAEGGFFRHS
jgi:cell division inhibitor SepF